MNDMKKDIGEARIENVEIINEDNIQRDAGAVNFLERLESYSNSDDITFAMIILSGLSECLSKKTPLSKKIAGAYGTLDNIRGGKPVAGDDWLTVIRERIFREVDRKYTAEDIKGRFEDKSDEDDDYIRDYYGLTGKEILSDGEIMNSIIERFENDSEWGDTQIDNLDNAIRRGIKDVLELRKIKNDE